MNSLLIHRPPPTFCQYTHQQDLTRYWSKERNTAICAILFIHPGIRDSTAEESLVNSLCHSCLPTLALTVCPFDKASTSLFLGLNSHNNTMHSFNRGGGRRQATPANVQCQKCLKRGHYSYECKAQLQERPYKARPSRTQQLLNPKLAPKLTNHVPDDTIRK